MRISVFAVEANPSIDPPFLRRSLGYCEREVRERRAAPVSPDDIRHGIQLLAPIRPAAVTTLFENVLGWNPQKWGGRLADSVVNRGRAGQFPDYPIPYAYEGHLTMPQAAVVNAVKQDSKAS